MLGTNGPGWLFCPADRPERFEKAAAAADVVILDLEDGVAAKDREAARRALVETRLDPAKTVVRVNPVTTPDHALDMKTLTQTDYTTVMLAKTETAEQVRSLAPFDVVVLVETPLGALAVTETAQAGELAAEVLLEPGADLAAERLVLGGVGQVHGPRLLVKLNGHA